jgi:glutamyl-tRNA synthetase
MTAERVRFAPSPTGYLHIGGVRTALYNWLWARQTKGTFILRIEDTDTERSTAESTQVIFDAMKWLGLDWDEGPGIGGPNGPYFQTERVEIYKEFADRMIERGTAYRCYASKEELDVERERQAKGGNPYFKYPGWWRDKGPKDWPTDGRPYVVRLKSPKSGSTGWVDLVKGRIDVPNDQQQDVVLIRGNGIPLYNFGAAVDDITMGITLVARGDDHVVNTPAQILIWEALGKTPPKFAHLPMINGPDGKKLSKRNAAVSVAEYRDMGFLPDAVLNYLARLGWSHGDQEIFSRSEMIEHFDWGHVGRTAAQYDLKKFQFVQSSHLRALSDADLGALARPFLAADLKVDEARYDAAVGTVKTRATTLIETAQMVDFYFRDTLSFDEKAVAKFLVPAAAATLTDFRAHLAAQSAFDRASLEAATTAWLTEKGLQIKDVAQAARVSLTGKSQSPGLYEVLEVLGKERVLARLDAGVQMASRAAAT